MRNILLAALVLPLSGCFFVYIPGSAISAVGDALSGQEGQHCVAETAKVGDSIRAPNGSVGTVKKLEGFSARCKDAAPVRALLVFDNR